MPADQPNSAPQGDAAHITDDLTAASVLHDGSLDRQPGGGGLGMPGGPVGEVAAGRTGATTPNSPIDACFPREAGNGEVEAEARAEVVEGAAQDPGHTPQ